MRLIGPSSLDEAVLAFHSAEVDSPRFHQTFTTFDRRLVSQPDLTDSAQNRARRAALAAYRGAFGVVGTRYLGTMPADTLWRCWTATPTEVGDMRFADYITWTTLTHGTRRVRDGAAAAKQLVVVPEGGIEVSAGIRQAARAIDAGAQMAEMIAVAKSVNAEARDLVLVEGHTRAAAYVLARKPPQEVMLLVGWSASKGRWPFL